MATTVGIFAGTVFTSTTQTMSQAVNATSGWIGVVLNVTDVTGTAPSVVFRVQWSMDGGTWADAEPGDEFEPITGLTTVAKRFDVKAPYWRAAVEVSEGATFTGTANAYI